MWGLPGIAERRGKRRPVRNAAARPLECFLSNTGGEIDPAGEEGLGIQALVIGHTGHWSHRSPGSESHMSRQFTSRLSMSSSNNRLQPTWLLWLWDSFLAGEAGPAEILVKISFWGQPAARSSCQEMLVQAQAPAFGHILSALPSTASICQSSSWLWPLWSACPSQSVLLLAPQPQSLPATGPNVDQISLTHSKQSRRQEDSMRECQSSRSNCIVLGLKGSVRLWSIAALGLLDP